MSGRAVNKLKFLSRALAANSGGLCATASNISHSAAAAPAAAAAAAAAALAFGPTLALRSYCRATALPLGAPSASRAPPRAALSHGLHGPILPGKCASLSASPSVSAARPAGAVRLLSNGPASTGAEDRAAASGAGATAATAASGPAVPPQETLVRQEARAIGGEKAAAAAAAGGTRTDAATVQQQPSQPQGQPQGQPQEPQGDGWDGEEEPPPVPLDPNAEVPGVLFVTAGAAISALIAVCIAALGILGTFYAGWVINSINKELQGASQAAEKQPPPAAAAGAAGAGPTAGASTPAAATVEAAGLTSHKTSKTEAAAKQKDEPLQARVAAPAEPLAAAAVSTPPPPPAAKRSWWSWLRLGGWRKPRAEGDDAARPSPA